MNMHSSMIMKEVCIDEEFCFTMRSSNQKYYNTHLSTRCLRGTLYLSFLFTFSDAYTAISPLTLFVEMNVFATTTPLHPINIMKIRTYGEGGSIVGCIERHSRELRIECSMFSPCEGGVRGGFTSVTKPPCVPPWQGGSGRVIYALIVAPDCCARETTSWSIALNCSLVRVPSPSIVRRSETLFLPVGMVAPA